MKQEKDWKEREDKEMGGKRKKREGRGRGRK